MKIRESKGDRLFEIIVYILLCLLLLIVTYPLIYVLSCSLSNPTAVGGGKVWLLPVDFTLSGYRRVFQEKSIMIGYGNTIFYTVFGTMINLAVTVPCGYALSKKEVPGRNLFMTFFMITMYFGGGLIPTFLVVKGLGLYNTRMVLLIQSLCGRVDPYN